MCFDYPQKDAEIDKAKPESDENKKEEEDVNFKLGKTAAQPDGAKKPIGGNPLSLEIAEDSKFNLNIGSNRLVYFILHHCPSNEESQLNIYHSYLNQFGINVDEYQGNENSRNSKFFNKCVDQLDFALMCNLLQANNIYEPTDYFAFYRDNLAVMFELSNINSRNYIDNGYLYTFKHVDCFNALCKYREFVVAHPNDLVPEEIQTGYDRVVAHDCCKKFNRKTFNGLFCGSVTQIKRKSNQNEFVVHTFNSDVISTDIKHENLLVHEPTNIKLGNEIQVRDVAGPTRFAKVETAERRNVAQVQLRPTNKTGIFTEAANDNANGLYAFRGFNLKFDPDTNFVFLSFSKLISFIPQ